LNGTYGSFTFNTTTGAWTYALDNTRIATQALTAGQVVHDTLTVSSSDSTASQLIDVTVNGSNDNATIGGTTTASVTDAVVVPPIVALSFDPLTVTSMSCEAVLSLLDTVSVSCTTWPAVSACVAMRVLSSA